MSEGPSTVAAAATPSRVRPRLLPALAAAALVVLTVQRFLELEAVNSYRADQLFWPVLAWIVGVILPLAGATVLFATRRGAALPGLAIGLVLGALLSTLDFLVSAAVAFPTAGYELSTAWLVTLLGALLLLWLLIAAGSDDVLSGTPLRRSWISAVAAFVVLAALVLWFSPFEVSWDWFPVTFVAILLAAVSLPVALLRLSDVQTRIGLAAVTTLGASEATYQILGFGADPLDDALPDPARLTVLVSVVAMVAAAWFAQSVGRRHR
jgi:hypothetical protein